MVYNIYGGYVMNVVDFVIIILLAFGAVEGFKAGVIKKTTDFVGMFAIVVLAFSTCYVIMHNMRQNRQFWSCLRSSNKFQQGNFLFPGYVFRQQYGRSLSRPFHDQALLYPYIAQSIHDDYLRQEYVCLIR